jgi:hypothetical protein
MSDIVERLRNWRTVHLAWLHLLMEEAADEMERLSLSANGDCPVPENAANVDNVLTAAERLVLQQVCDEYADEDDVRCNEIAYVIDRILARTKSNDNTQDGAEPSSASAGSQPVAWIAVFDGHDADGEFVWPDRGRAMEWASARQGVTIAPLYLQPQPTLTDAEREAVAWCVEMAATTATECDEELAALRGLLERTK